MSVNDPVPNVSCPRGDRRSVNDLINAALTEPEDAAWDAIWALHYRGTREVLDRAVSLCRSACPEERSLGADILGQLGVPDRTFSEERAAVLFDMLKAESDAGVLRSILCAISHNQNEQTISVFLQFVDHPDVDVRQAVVMALSGNRDEDAINTLIRMSSDSEPFVRDWATFGLGTQSETDTKDLRDALANRLDDHDEDTRGEAFVGLAKRGDRRVVPALLPELTSDDVCSLAVEAAKLIRAPELYLALVDLREWWDVDYTLLEEAVTACHPQP